MLDNAKLHFALVALMVLSSGVITCVNVRLTDRAQHNANVLKSAERHRPRIDKFALPAELLAAREDPETNSYCSADDTGTHLFLIGGEPCVTCTAALDSWRQIIDGAEWTKDDCITMVALGKSGSFDELERLLVEESIPHSEIQINDPLALKLAGIGSVPTTVLQTNGRVQRIIRGRIDVNTIEELDLKEGGPGRPALGSIFVDAGSFQRLHTLTQTLRSNPDCMPYDSTALRLSEFPDGRWQLLTAEDVRLATLPSRELGILARRVARAYSHVCYIGRGNGPIRSVLQYRLPLETAPPIIDRRIEDCIGYRPNDVQIKTTGTEFRLVSGAQLIGRFSNAGAVQLARRLIMEYDKRCFIGRPSTDSTPVMQYWRREEGLAR